MYVPEEKDIEDNNTDKKNMIINRIRQTIEIYKCLKSANCFKSHIVTTQSKHKPEFREMMSLPANRDF